jgi:Uma2 family endonuclease
MHKSADPGLLTLEEYEALPADDGSIDEVSHGRLVREPQPAYEHGRIAARMAHLLLSYIDAHPGIGQAVGAAGFVLEDTPLTLRGPDVAFVRAGRPTPGRGFFRGAPDIAVEIVSPSNSAADLQQKILELIDAGTALVWVVYPASRTVIEHRSRSEISILRADDVLTTPLLPGFAAPVSTLFD